MSVNAQMVLEMTGISKEFPGVRALSSVDFNLKRGEVHALVGENGAGKSTLIKILAGIYTKDAGQIRIDGKEAKLSSPVSSLEHGIAFVHQEPNVFPSLTALESMFMGHKAIYGRFGRLKGRHRRQWGMRLVRELDIDLDLDTPIFMLGAGKRQLVSILRALVRDPKIIVLDEPTAPLTEQEIRTLFRIIRNLNSKGVSVIYVSHRLGEIFEICDRVTVLRDGRLVKTLEVAETNVSEVIRLMLAKDLTEKFYKVEIPIGEELLSVQGLAGGVVRNVSLAVRSGEILGIAGVVGSGRTELCRLLFGLDKPEAGEIRVNSNPVRIKSPLDATKAGICLVPEERRRYGIFPDLNVAENVTISNLEQVSSLKGTLVAKPKEKNVADKYVKALSIRTPTLEQLCKFLSGGNQQKVVVARWLCSNARVFVFDEPTMGIDVGSKSEIYRLMIEICRQGGAIILVSSDFEEVLGMADRVTVMRRGSTVWTADRQEASLQRLFAEAVAGGVETDAKEVQ